MVWWFAACAGECARAPLPPVGWCGAACCAVAWRLGARARACVCARVFLLRVCACACACARAHVRACCGHVRCVPLRPQVVDSGHVALRPPPSSSPHPHLAASFRSPSAPAGLLGLIPAPAAPDRAKRAMDCHAKSEMCDSLLPVGDLNNVGYYTEAILVACDPWGPRIQEELLNHAPTLFTKDALVDLLTLLEDLLRHSVDFVLHALGDGVTSASKAVDLSVDAWPPQIPTHAPCRPSGARYP